MRTEPEPACFGDKRTEWVNLRDDDSRLSELLMRKALGGEMHSPRMSLAWETGRARLMGLAANTTVQPGYELTPI